MYRYRISSRKQGLSYPDCAWLPYTLDGVLLSAAAGVFIGRHNFQNFCVDEGERGYECEIFRLEVAAVEDGWVFTVEANRFLQRMVRMMTGAMVDVARGFWLLEKMSELLEGPLVIQKATALPPQGLCLMKVIYPEEIEKVRRLEG
jgi:tRNA pseudouridine38-40 synthase